MNNKGIFSLVLSFLAVASVVEAQDDSSSTWYVGTAWYAPLADTFTGQVNLVLPSDALYYSDGTLCSDNHSTLDGGPFAHWHVPLDLQSGSYTGYDANLVAHTVTAYSCGRFWDRVYGVYPGPGSYGGGGAGVDATYNCYGYALVYQSDDDSATWIDDPAPILAHEYTYKSGWLGTNNTSWGYLVDYQQSQDHMITGEGWWNVTTEQIDVGTSEKDRESATYSRSWIGGGPSGDLYKFTYYN